MSGLFHQALLRNYVCAQCHSPLTERYVNGRWIVVCSHDPSHGGLHRQTTVILQERQALLEGIELSYRFPMLAPPSLDDGKTADELIAELF